MSPWTVYWITRLDTIGAICGVSVVCGLIIFAIALFANLMDESDRAAYTCRVALMVVAIAAIIGSLAPSTKEAIAIYALPKIVNNEKVQQIPENAVDLLNEQMKAWLGDLRGKEAHE